MPQTKHESPARPVGMPDTEHTDGPIRQCALTRERKPQTELIRFVRSPDGYAVPDILEKIPGRGAWVTATRGAVEEAGNASALNRAFKADTKPMPDAATLIERQLTQRCIGLIGMAKKSGVAIIGFDQVRAYLRHKEPGWLLEASDGAEDGRNKVHFLAKAIYDHVGVAGALSSTELGMAFGRDSVIHGLLEAGRLAESFGVAYQRLKGFRPAPEADWFCGARDN